MPEDYYTSQPAARPRTGPSLRALLLAGLISFLGGAGLIGWLVWNGKIDLGQAAAPAAVVAGQSLAAAPAPNPAASTAANAAATAAAAALDQQVAALERRLAQLNLQAAAADGNTARAEGLLVALAARRAIEQGKPLDYLEAQLQTRFGTARPAAVTALITAAKTPVTLDRLAAQLDELAPALLGQPNNEDGWSRVRRELSGLFVIRHDDGKVGRPDARLDNARILLRSGQIEAAMAEVSRLPGNASARDWMVAARRYADAQAALDQIEQAALTEPELLKGGDGEAVQQPGLSATPTA